MEHWDAITAGRLALAGQLDGLDDEMWSRQSLCGAWSVHDVVAHLVAPIVRSRTVVLCTFTRDLIVAGGRFDRANLAGTRRAATSSSAELVVLLRAHASSTFAPPGLGSIAQLTDVYVHGQDIRIPVGLSTPEPAQAWTPVLDFLLTRKSRRGFAARPLPAVRLVASDVAWSAGDGPEVRGPAVALALTLLGRPVRADELNGEGATGFVAAMAR